MSQSSARDVNEGLERWLDPRSTRDELRALGLPIDEVTSGYRRLREDGSAVLVFELRGRTAAGESVTRHAYVRRFGDPARQSEVEEKWKHLKVRDSEWGEGLRRLADGDGLLLLFPNDLRLRDLFQVTNVDKLKRLLSDLPALVGAEERVRGRRTKLTIMRYKPEHRLVARLDIGLRNDATGESRSQSLFLRYFADARGARLEAIADLLREAGFQHAPDSIGTLLGGAVHLESCLDGAPLLEVLARADGNAVCELASATAAVVANLHVADTTGGIGRLPDRESWARRCNEAIFALRRSGSVNAAEAEELLSRVETLDGESGLAAGRAAILHGDLHLHQFLVGEEGPALVDFERCALGDPLDDVGNLLAHVESLAGTSGLANFADAFVEGYRTAVGRRAIDFEKRLAAFTASAHLEQALLPLRRMESNGLAQAREGVERARLAFARAALAMRADSSEAADEASIRSNLDDERGILDDLDREGLRWAAVFPTWKGAWPVRFDAEGSSRFATFDPQTREVEMAALEEDPRLCGATAWLPGGTLVAYRPGKRAVIRIATAEGDQYVKVLPRKKAEPFARRLRALERCVDDAGIVSFPTLAPVVARDVARGEFVFGALSGETLLERLRGGAAADGRSIDEDFERIARALVAFQSKRAASIAERNGLELAQEETGIADTRRWCDLVEKTHPRERAAIKRARRGVDAALAGCEAATEPRLVHGDLHDKNIILTSQAAVGLLDLDSVRLGDASFDVGNVAAQLILRGLQAGGDPEAGRRWAERWFAAYHDALGIAPIARARVLMCASLLRLAQVYRFRRRWIELAPRLLAASMDELETVS